MNFSQADRKWELILSILIKCLDMEEKLKQLRGKRVDVNCGAAAVFRGVVEDVDDHILVLKDENDLITNISLRKIIAVTECVEPLSRPGFIV
ncbi:MAG: hypothetical protein DMF62_00580 [Acidobacteria bacterium]|nr:MAG: hypothetical protein DMF62_00580 [Acidobacteriota bacterium]